MIPLINCNPEYPDRLHRHYVLVKEKIEGAPYRSGPFQTPDDMIRKATPPFAWCENG